MTLRGVLLTNRMGYYFFRSLKNNYLYSYMGNTLIEQHEKNYILSFHPNLVWLCKKTCDATIPFINKVIHFEIRSEVVRIPRSIIRHINFFSFNRLSSCFVYIYKFLFVAFWKSTALRGQCDGVLSLWSLYRRYQFRVEVLLKRKWYSFYSTHQHTVYRMKIRRKNTATAYFSAHVVAKKTYACEYLEQWFW